MLIIFFPRKGEPDVYLLTRWTEQESPKVEEARAAAYRQHMAMTTTQMQQALGQRADYRELVGMMLLRSMKFRD